MIDIKHALNRYVLLAGFIGLLLVPLLVVLFSERRFPHERHETVNLPRYVKNAAPIAFSFYEEEARILIHLPSEGETYVARHRVTHEDLIDGIKKVKAERPADAGIVYLKAGVGVSHESVVETLKAIRAAGIDRVGLVVMKEQADGGGEKVGFLEVKLYR